MFAELDQARGPTDLGVQSTCAENAPNRALERIPQLVREARAPRHRRLQLQVGEGGCGVRVKLHRPA